MVNGDMVVSFGSPMVRTAMFALVSTSIACGGRSVPATTTPTPVADPARVPHAIVPVPASVQMVSTGTFAVDSATQVFVAAGGNEEAQRIAAYLAYLLTGPLGPASRLLYVVGPAP